MTPGQGVGIDPDFACYLASGAKFGRHPGVALRLLADMADAREGQVHPGDHQLFASSLVKDTFAGDDGLFRVVVVFKGDFRTSELDRMVVHQIAEDQQALVTALEQVAGMAGVWPCVSTLEMPASSFTVAVEGLPLARWQGRGRRRRVTS